jgi:hypothetical protein
MTAAERRRRRRRNPGAGRDITEARIAAVEARIKELKCPPDTIEKALHRLATPFAFPLGDRNLVVACLIRKHDWRPLKATWQEACIIGAHLTAISFCVTAMEVSGIESTKHKPTRQSRGAFENSFVGLWRRGSNHDHGVT